MVFVPNRNIFRNGDTVRAIRDIERHEGTYKAGHTFTLTQSLGDSIYGIYTLKDSDGRVTSISELVATDYIRKSHD